jgi:predicted transcriptional regulator
MADVVTIEAVHAREQVISRALRDQAGQPSSAFVHQSTALCCGLSEGPMGVVRLPDQLSQVIARQVAEGRAESEAAYLEEAIRRYAEDLDAEDDIFAAAEAGIRDVEAGRYVSIASPDNAEALHDRTMSRLRGRLGTDVG